MTIDISRIPRSFIFVNFENWRAITTTTTVAHIVCRAPSEIGGIHKFVP